MKGTLGLIEVTGLSLAITVADVMVKRASVELSEIENSNGSGWMLVKVSGDYASVQMAIDSATEYAKGVNGWIASRVIARPGFELFGMSSYPPVPIDSEHHQPTGLAIDSDKSVVEQLSDDSEPLSELSHDLNMETPPPETADSELFMVQDLDAEGSVQAEMVAELSEVNQTDWLFDISDVDPIQQPELADIIDDPEIESGESPSLIEKSVVLAEAGASVTLDSAVLDSAVLDPEVLNSVVLDSIVLDSIVLDNSEEALVFKDDSFTESEMLAEELMVEVSADVDVEVDADIEQTMTAAEWVDKPKFSRKATLAAFSSAVAPSSRIYGTAKQTNKSAGRHICKVCFDPECTRKKREPHSYCLHAND